MCKRQECVESFRHLWDSVTESDTKMVRLAPPLTLTGGATGGAFFPVKEEREERKLQERDNMTHGARERQLDRDPVG